MKKDIKLIITSTDYKKMPSQYRSVSSKGNHTASYYKKTDDEHEVCNFL